MWGSRLLQNRLSAAASRQRRKDYTQLLETRCGDLHQEVLSASLWIAALEEELSSLQPERFSALLATGTQFRLKEELNEPIPPP